MNPRRFFAELKRRNVYKVAVAYAVVAWLVIQVCATIVPALHLSDVVTSTVVVVVLLGFPIALVLAWAFELTPEGIKRAEDVLPSESITHHTGGKLIRLTIAVATVAAALLAWQFLRPKPRAAPLAAAPAPALAGPTTAAAPDKSIAVLPFESLSEDKANAYFADGIQDQILTKLASVGDLKVISRTSTGKYKSRPEDLKTVARELGVATVLEGTVQRAEAKVRVNVQLIDARADSHLWAKSYDRDLKDVFAIQSEVAQEIADALQAKLSPAEAKTVARAPTNDPQAYDLFLKGEYEHRLASSNQRAESFDQATLWYKEAIARDPHFALAIAQLVICRMRRHWLAETATEAELVDLGTTAKQSLSLAPDLAEAHVAMGVYHYYGFREYEPALAEFQRAIDLQPNHSLALEFIGYVHRRQAKWDETVNDLRRAMEQDPRNAGLSSNLAQTYMFLRQWQQAEDAARHALAIDPHDATGMSELLEARLNRTGNVAEVLQLVATYPADDLLIANSGTYSLVTGDRAAAFILGRDYQAALQVWQGGGKSGTNEGQRLAALTIPRVLAGDVGGVRDDAQKARELLEARLRERPTEVRSLRALSWVYLALDRKNDAVNTARHVLELLPPEKDALLGPSNLVSVAEIHARTGGTKEAVDILRRLLAVPAGEVVSIARLKVDPVWDPIRNDPGFQQLLAEGKEQIGPNN